MKNADISSAVDTLVSLLADALESARKQVAPNAGDALRVTDWADWSRNNMKIALKNSSLLDKYSEDDVINTSKTIFNKRAYDFLLNFLEERTKRKEPGSYRSVVENALMGFLGGSFWEVDAFLKKQAMQSISVELIKISQTLDNAGFINDSIATLNLLNNLLEKFK